MTAEDSELLRLRGSMADGDKLARKKHFLRNLRTSKSYARGLTYISLVTPFLMCFIKSINVGCMGDANP